MIREMKREPATIPIFDTLQNSVVVESSPRGLTFWWSRKGVGFGSLHMGIGQDGKFVVDTECMGVEICGEIVKQAIVEALARQKSEEGQA